MRPCVLLSILGAVLLGTNRSWAANWAVLVAGSHEWMNYRHQADVCHAYQILHKNGIPDSNIIVMMYDDLAHHLRNPTKGIIINHPKGEDVYHGVPHDYTGKDVTPQNFLNVLLGNKAALKGVGSGKVLESGADDHVFIYYTDHGAVGLVAFPHGVLYAKAFNQTITTMYNAKKYKQMVIYIEACESGSMFEDILSDQMNVYGTTASNAQESSYACYHDLERGTYLGDVYSVVWMEDSDVEELDRETLFQQYTITQKKTNTSHVMQYGDLNLAKSHNVSEFQGAQRNSSKPKKTISTDRYNQLLRRDAVPAKDVRIESLKRRLAITKENSTERIELEAELHQLRNTRQSVSDSIYRIAFMALSLNRASYLERVTEKRMKLTRHDCYMSVTQHIHGHCFDLQHEFVLSELFIMANLCEIGLSDSTIMKAIDQVCEQRVHFEY